MGGKWQHRTLERVLPVGRNSLPKKWRNLMSTQNVTPKIKNPMTIALTLALLLSVIVPAMAQADKGASGGIDSTTPVQAQGPTDAVEMEAFLDGLFTKEMEEYHIPGAALSVVKDGQLFFAKGYGYADLENKIPVDAKQTIFPGRP